MKKRILFPIVILGGMVLSSCSGELPVNYTPEDQTIPTEWVDYNVVPTGIKFGAGEENLYIKNTDEPYAYHYTVTPKGASAHLSWVVGDESVATVENGVVTPKLQGGHTTVTVSDASGAFTPVTLNVHVTVDIQAFHVEAPTEELDINKSYTFTTSFTPENTTYKELIWTIPDEESELASVQNGVLTTYGDRNTDTTIHLTVTSGKLPDYSKTFELHLKDRKIHVDTVSLALATGESDTIEIGKTSQVVAAVVPETADDLSELAYFSREPEIASVDPTTGVITGLKDGDAHIFAHCEDKDSEPVLIHVYEVFATAVHIDKSHDYVVSNDDDEAKAIAVSYETSKAGVDVPSKARATFASDDVAVVKVDKDSGVLTAVSSGVAHITASVVKEDGTLASDTVEVTSTIYGTSVDVFGEHSCYLDSTITLTAKVSPESAVDDVVSWTWTPETRANGVASGNSITLTPLEEGPIEVKATSTHFGASKVHSVSFSERPVYFEEGTIYLVGDQQFNTGTSAKGISSWTNAKYAYAITETATSEDPKVEKQYKATIYFHEGDVWKLREGPDNTGWKDLFHYEDSKKVEDYEIAGALDGNYMRADSTMSGNIHVLVEGSYDIYYKVLVGGGYAVYVGHTPTISFDKPALSLGAGASTKITLHNYAEGAINIQNSEPSIASVSSGTATASGIEYTVTAGSTSGSTTITATDINGKAALCHVTVDASSTGVNVPLYLNANGIFDNDGAVPFVRAFKDANSYKDILMVKASGQDIIYTADIPEDFTGATFVRMAPGSTAIDWTTRWNQSKPADETFGDNNMFTITGFDNEDGTYLTGTWGMYDENIHYKAPAEYYLVGTFNGWAQYDAAYGFEQSGNTYKLEGVTLSEGDELKVHDKGAKDAQGEAAAAHWHTNATDGTYYTVQATGDHNIVISHNGTYDVYYNSGSTNPITFVLSGETPPAEFDDYIIHYGTPGESDWADVQMVLTGGLYVGEVTVAAGQELVLHLTGDVWRGYADLDDATAALTNFSETAGEDNNIAVVTGGTYVVKLNASLEAKSINITVKGDEPTPVLSSYYLKGDFNGWSEVAAYQFVADPLDANHFKLEGVEIAGGQKMKVYAPDTDKWYTSEEPWVDCGFTKDGEGNLIVSANGVYTVNFYLVDQYDKDNHVTIEKTGDYEPVDPPGPSTKVTYTVNSLPSWTSDGGCVLFAWVWNGSGSSWVSVSLSGTTATFEVDAELTGFLIVRCAPGTTEPDYNKSGDGAGRIYNKSADIICSAGVYAYSCSGLPDYSPN